MVIINNIILEGFFMIKILFYIFLLLPFSLYSVADDHAIKSKPVINLSLAKVMADACEADQKKNRVCSY